MKQLVKFQVCNVLNIKSSIPLEINIIKLKFYTRQVRNHLGHPFAKTQKFEICAKKVGFPRSNHILGPSMKEAPYSQVKLQDSKYVLLGSAIRPLFTYNYYTVAILIQLASGKPCHL